MKKVCVIIPNFNGAHYLDDCLTSLYQVKKSDFDCLVVDNGSTDDSLKLLKTKFPQVDVLSLKENTGFCHAVNRGVQKAGNPYVILLNNDTVVLEGFIEALVAAMEQSTKLFSVSSKMLSLHNKEIIDDCGDLYTAFGYALSRGKGKEADKTCLKECNVFAACGGASIYRRDLFLQLGMLDENHFAYLEDIDLGYRAKIEGYRNGFCPTAKVLHVGSGFSGSRYNEFKIRQSGKNNIYLIYKNMPLLQLLLNFPFLLTGFLIKELFFIRKGFGRIYFESLLNGLRFCNTKSAKEKKVPFQFKNCINYVTIQVELFLNIFRSFFS